jgi:hypothetical protein
MKGTRRKFVSNQVFLGLPWKNVRAKYDRIIAKLDKKYPIHFTIVGRNDQQDAEDLFEIIKQRIASSSYAVFDATGGNANVSLEYGYAEGLEVPRAIFLSAHKAAQKHDATSPIISDLGGKRRVQYKTEVTLSSELHKLCRQHDYTKRFEKALSVALKGKTKGAKKSGRALALKIVHALDGKGKIRRAELFQQLQAIDYEETVIDALLKRLHTAGVIKCSVGNYSDVYVA